MRLARRRTGRAERVGIYLDKRFETVIACFGATAAGGVFVPLNPLLKPEQIAYILRDCNVAVLVTSRERYAILRDALAGCQDLRHIILTGDSALLSNDAVGNVHRWSDVCDAGDQHGHRVIDTDMVGDPLHVRQHRQAEGRRVVASEYGGRRKERRVLSRERCERRAARGAARCRSMPASASSPRHSTPAPRVVLLNYLMPRDVLNALANERVTGHHGRAAAVDPAVAARVADSICRAICAISRTPAAACRWRRCKLRAQLPQAKPYLMYGLTEAFRSTYLPPEEVDRRPDSIGKAIPNAEMLVLRPDGTPVRRR